MLNKKENNFKEASVTKIFIILIIVISIIYFSMSSSSGKSFFTSFGSKSKGKEIVRIPRELKWNESFGKKKEEKKKSFFN